MQLRSIILYSKSGDKRVLDFRLGELNIVTGTSQTGKSALLDIVDFCLGRDEITLPATAIFRTVAWYAVMLQLDDTRVFVARPAPGPNARSVDMRRQRPARRPGRELRLARCRHVLLQRGLLSPPTSHDLSPGIGIQHHWCSPESANFAPAITLSGGQDSGPEHHNKGLSPSGPGRPDISLQRAVRLLRL
ncbi:hypothetical protein ACWDXD_32255 [Streptomyces sp. NPDC003314]